MTSTLMQPKTLKAENNAAHIVELPKILDERGNLSFLENNHHVPFIIMRSYWVYDVPGGGIRGGYAFKEQQQMIIALSGSFEVKLNDGNREFSFMLNRSYYGLYIPKMMWRSLENFSTNSLAFVVSDKHYNSDDYIRDFNDFKYLKNA